MKFLKNSLFFIFLCFPLSVFCNFKVLHLTFHKGCDKELQFIARKLNFDLHTLFIPTIPKEHFDGKTSGSDRYNIDAEKAHNIWEKNKDYFYEFDLIITSDTAPLARIFLQNNFEKPLIIWVCNRFDYHDGRSLIKPFPDPPFYDLFRQAIHKKNIKIFSYTPFEHIYAKTYRNVHSWSDVLKPTGTYTDKSENFQSAIPKHIDKSSTLFIPPYHNDTNFKTKQVLEKMGMACYRGRYNGPHDLAEFKAVVHIPYAWSNLALFENWQNAVIYFIPSKQFFKKLSRKPGFFFSPPFNLKYIEYSEWYNPIYAENFVFFDSWQDLRRKIINTNYQSKRKIIQEFAIHHKKQTLDKWKATFQQLNLLD